MKQHTLLHDAIIQFLSILLECLNGTSYSVDRPIYLQDIATASNWIVRLNQGEALENLVEEIRSSSTNKQFGDYFRQGKFGSKEADGLKNLQEIAKLLI